MTIEELARTYNRSADLVWQRIRELELAVKEADDSARPLLEARLRPLRTIYRDTRQTARYLERYYGKRRGERE